MRPITVTLMQNTGTTAVGASVSLEDRLVDLGQISWQLDEQLAKSTPGQFTAKIWDEDGSVWAWIQSQLPTTDPAAGAQLLPPWLVVTVGGQRRFLGLVDPTTLQRERRDQIIQISANDWSTMLRDQVLEGDGWTRTPPKVVATRSPGGPWLATMWLWNNGNLLYFADAAGNPTIAAGDIEMGDTLRIGTVYCKATGVLGNWVTVQGWTWASAGNPASVQVYREGGDISDQTWYTAQETIAVDAKAPVYSVQFDTLDGLFPGDSMVRIGTGDTLPILDVDPERKRVITVEPVSMAIATGDKFTLSQESFEQLVFQEVGSLLERAAAPFAVDLSRFAPAALPLPVFAWLALQNPGTDQNLRQLVDLEPTLTQLRAVGADGNAWTGTPEVGYIRATGSVARFVDWTAQAAAAPARLMPDVSPAYTTRQRNRCYYDWVYTHPVYMDSAWNPLATPTFTPSTRPYPGSEVCFDYAAFRRFSVVNGAGPTFSEASWSGSAWSTETHPAPPAVSGGPWFPCSMAPMVGVAATTGPTPLGQALLCLVVNGAGTARQLHLYWAGAGAVTLDITSCPGAVGGVLVTTPWGVYLVGPGGYGRITYTGGALALAWVTIFEKAYNWLLPSTLAATDAGHLYCLARMDAYTDGKLVTETWMLRLADSPDPAHPEAAILYEENCTPGAPALATLMRDPSLAGRMVGVMGSRLFQVAATMPRTIERVRALSMSAGEMLEHLAQVHNALLVPRPDGVLEFISRNTPATVTALTLDQVAITETRLSPNFFSVVRVTGAEDSVYADAFGATYGGRALDVASHPMVWTVGQCYAMATALVAFLGVPRNQQAQTWFWEDADSAPPWESLPRWGGITVNGGATTWIVTGMTEDLVKGTCKATLLEVP